LTATWSITLYELLECTSPRLKVWTILPYSGSIKIPEWRWSPSWGPTGWSYASNT